MRSTCDKHLTFVKGVIGKKKKKKKCGCHCQHHYVTCCSVKSEERKLTQSMKNSKLIKTSASTNLWPCNAQPDSVNKNSCWSAAAVILLFLPRDFGVFKGFVWIQMTVVTKGVPWL